MHRSPRKPVLTNRDAPCVTNPAPPERLAPERLAGSWAKLTRAQGHVEELKRAIIAACDGEGPPRVLATRRQFDPENNLVLWIAERVPEVSDDWGLMVGEAIYNMRCALDHLWWQLAIDHLGRKPTEDEAREIMFPILTFLDSERFRRHRYLKHVSPEAAEKAERCQRYDAREDEVLLLTVLATLSNRDKHREIQPAARIAVMNSARLTRSIRPLTVSTREVGHVLARTGWVASHSAGRDSGRSHRTVRYPPRPSTPRGNEAPPTKAGRGVHVRFRVRAHVAPPMSDPRLIVLMGPAVV